MVTLFFLLKDRHFVSIQGCILLASNLALLPLIVHSLKNLYKSPKAKYRWHKFSNFALLFV